MFMTSTLAFWIFLIACSAFLLFWAIVTHRRAMMRRQALFDDAAALLVDAKITFAADRFPILCGYLNDRRKVKIELIADTLVTRRLPQLWLRTTLSETSAQRRPLIGALARPTGAEFYSLVHDMPVQMVPPQTDAPLLMRGDGAATTMQVECVSSVFRTLFADPTIKEAVIAPRGTRLVHQVCQGDRGAHLVMRQAHFPIKTVSADLVRRALKDVLLLSETLPEDETTERARAA